MAFYRTFYDLASLLPERERQKTVTAMLDYFFEGVEPTGLGENGRKVFEGVRGRIDKAKQNAANVRSRYATEPDTEAPTDVPTKRPTKAPTNDATEGENGSPVRTAQSGSGSESESGSESGRKDVASAGAEACRAGARRKATARQRREIVGYLNAKTGKAFKPDAKATATLINGRFAEGFTVDDFKRVIDVKCADWIGCVSSDGRDMGEYLCPKTLFRPSNFEGYLNAEATAPAKAAAASFTAEQDADIQAFLAGDGA